MAVALSISVTGVKELQAQLDRINPKKNSAMVWRALEECGELVQIDAAYRKIIAGGRFRGPPGPRGGKGKLVDRAPHPKKLTSRTGTLRRSIAVNRVRSALAVEVGTGLVYGAVHEEGGSFGVRSHTVRSHQRSSAFGKKTRRFTVPSHFRSGHYADYPARPYLAPALDDMASKFSDVFSREIAKEIR
jgi:phage gpG-like protein